jgi:TonB family protein
MNRAWAVPVFFLSVTMSSFSSAQKPAPSLQQLLESKLKGSVVSLRNPSPNTSFSFDGNGKSTLKVEHGLASVDRDILIKEVKVTGASMQIKGDRIYYTWDSKNNRLQGTNQKDNVYLSLSFPKPPETEADIAPALNEMFLTGKEMAEGVCKSEENAAFSQLFLNGKPRHLSKQEQIDEKNAPAAQSKAELDLICVQNGQRGYRTKNGIIAAKPLITDDPTYSESARRKKIQGTAVYAVRIDEHGLPTDALLVQPLEPTLNLAGIAALRGWKFQPATFQGEPLPVVLMVEINFRLH